MSQSIVLTMMPGRQPGLTCAQCQSSAEGATAMSSDFLRSPPQLRPGAFLLCAYCGALNVAIESFASFRTISLRLATPEEEQQAAAILPALHAARVALKDRLARRRG